MNGQQDREKTVTFPRVKLTELPCMCGMGNFKVRIGEELECNRCWVRVPFIGSLGLCEEGYREKVMKKGEISIND